MDQLTLDFDLKPKRSMDALVIHAGNRLAVDAIKSLSTSSLIPAQPVIIWGGQGTGKTHLLRAAFDSLNTGPNTTAEDPQFIECASDSDYGANLAHLVQWDDVRLRSSGCVILDDLDYLREDMESPLWTILTKAARTSIPLIMSTTAPPWAVFPLNPHIRSRLESALSYKLESPDDRTGLLIVDKLMRDRNVRVSQDVCRYLVNHYTRNMKEMEEFIRVLDQESLRMKRRITIPFIKQVHQGMESTGPKSSC